MFGPGVESPAADAPVEVPPRSPARALKQQWARLITQVYKADPQLCPQCGGPTDHCLHSATRGQ